jgi:hypothetical protein
MNKDVYNTMIANCLNLPFQDYSKDWNTLMVAVNKVNSLEGEKSIFLYSFVIHPEACYVEGADIREEHGADLLEVAYYTLVKFVEYALKSEVGAERRAKADKQIEIIKGLDEGEQFDVNISGFSTKTVVKLDDSLFEIHNFISGWQTVEVNEEELYNILLDIVEIGYLDWE